MIEAYQGCNNDDILYENYALVSSLGTRTVSGNFSGPTRFNSPRPPPPPGPPGPRPPPPPGPPPPGPPGPRPPLPHYPPGHRFPHTYRGFQGFPYPTSYMYYDDPRYLYTNPIYTSIKNYKPTFFEIMDYNAYTYPENPSESDINNMIYFIRSLPQIIPCTLSCRQYTKYFIETYIKNYNNDLRVICSNRKELINFFTELKRDITNKYGYDIRYTENINGIY
jgi:hypothetical protein